MKTIKINGIEFAADEIRKSKWETDRSHLSVSIEARHERGEDDREQEIKRCGEGDGVVKWSATLYRADVEDEEPWECAYTHVTALDGGKHTIFVEESCDSKWLIYDGCDECYPSDARRIDTVEDEDGYDSGDICSVCDTIPDISVDNGMPTYSDYEAEAERYVSQLPATRKAWIDRARGFANEWTLYIDPSGTAEPRESWEAVDDSYIVSYLADAVCPGEIYKSEYLSDKCCGAMEIEEVDDEAGE